MKSSSKLFLTLGVIFLPCLGWAQASDLVPPEVRAKTVKQATKLLEPREYTVKPMDAVSPFAPPTFDQPDPEELKAQQAAAAAAAAAGVVKRPTGDRGTLELLAERIVPSGILHMGGDAILLFGQKKLKVGDRLTIIYEGSNFDLEISAIGSTTFTLRYNSEEITRSIKPGKQL
ncbi:MAG: hypothetical protein K9M98_08745 [Cephaloticoccus sp.]|nr:hypothetical protein [Cephaloticoccus sp.]MCF7760578.1 hypothetical protein [Cephaloticoccus sp.]